MWVGAATIMSHGLETRAQVAAPGHTRQIRGEGHYYERLFMILALPHQGEHTLS